MTAVRETETKFELSRDSFDRLKGFAQVERTICQRNVYYDQRHRLSAIAATCRFRFSDGDTPVFTVKLPVTRARDSGTRVMDELNIPVPSAVPDRLPIEIDVERALPPVAAEALLAVGVNLLRCMGEARNWRTIAMVDGIGELELDCLELPGGHVVYEAEIESDDRSVHEALSRWILERAPEARHSAISKAERVRLALQQVSSNSSSVDDHFGLVA
jgi:hypothetical protein